jgi:hypothetical protein
MPNLYDKVALREEYHNRFLDLQYKKRKNKKDFIIIALLMIYFMEHFTNPTTEIIELKAPFILKIKNIDKPKVVVNAVESALQGEGKLAKHIEIFIKKNDEEMSFLTNIIPQKEPKIKQISENRKEKYYQNLNEQTDLVEENNDISLTMNKFILNKKMKQWNTQRDKRVRKTTFHNVIDRQTVFIDDYFEVAGARALFPAHNTLPPYERLGCRCYLTYY